MLMLSVLKFEVWSYLLIAKMQVVMMIGLCFIASTASAAFNPLETVIEEWEV